MLCRLVATAMALVIFWGSPFWSCARIRHLNSERPEAIVVAPIEGIPVPAVDDAEAPYPDLEELIQEGRDLEFANRFPEALSKYREAETLDPGEPVTQLHIGEFYRHHDGDWGLAETYFEKVLANEAADDEVRALALHGLGKMTIWRGEFARGLDMLEESVGLYPTPLAYRNLAVFWFSEDAYQKARGYMEKALALAPEDAYNQVFAATFLAYEGKRKETLAILESVPFDPSMYYNFAVIYAELGEGERALQYLRDHFYTYEYNDRVRAYEMQEALTDYHFRNLYHDPRFQQLTARARRPPGKALPFWVDESVKPYRGAKESR